MDPVKLLDWINHWTDHVLQWALILAAISTITMALLELIKAVLLLRPTYHGMRLRSWLRGPQAFEELLSLSVGDGAKRNALLDQPTNKMMGQIQAAVSVALDFPTKYSNLFGFLTKQSPTDADVWRNFCDKLEQKDATGAATPTDEAEARAATRARARIDHFVARKLDSFQTVTEYVWARLNQAAAIGAASIFIFYMLYSGTHQFTSRSIMASLFGGMLAPLAKDIVSALSGLRAGKS